MLQLSTISEAVLGGQVLVDEHHRARAGISLAEPELILAEENNSWMLVQVIRFNSSFQDFFSARLCQSMRDDDGRVSLKIEVQDRALKKVHSI